MLEILIKPFEYLLFGFISAYFIFALLVWRQVVLLTESVRTGSRYISLLFAVVHVFLSFLVLVAAVAIVF
ncbi:MAG: DUF5657 family protein [Patescibacteria group bacterium]